MRWTKWENADNKDYLSKVLYNFLIFVQCVGQRRKILSPLRKTTDVLDRSIPLSSHVFLHVFPPTSKSFEKCKCIAIPMHTINSQAWQCLAPAFSFTPRSFWPWGKVPVTHWTEGWLGPRAGSDAFRNYV